MLPHRTFQDALRSTQLFISGKGGVGKTSVSQALASAFAAKGKRTLWITFEDPSMSTSLSPKSMAENLWYLNITPQLAFEEYMGLKLGAVAKLFSGNKLIRFLLEAAPGLTEQVLIGKVWYERLNYDHLVVDMPSTGYGIAMFQSVKNFHRLFNTGPLARDAGAMLESFRSQEETAQIIVGLPEETPLCESLELAGFLTELFPENPPAFLLNRRFPQVQATALTLNSSTQPISDNTAEFSVRRSALETENLKIWQEKGFPFEECAYFSGDPLPRLTREMADHL